MNNITGPFRKICEIGYNDGTVEEYYNNGDVFLTYFDEDADEFVTEKDRVLSAEELKERMDDIEKELGDFRSYCK